MKSIKHEIQEKWREIIAVCNDNQDAIHSFELFEGYIEERENKVQERILKLIDEVDTKQQGFYRNVDDTEVFKDKLKQKIQGK